MDAASIFTTAIDSSWAYTDVQNKDSESKGAKADTENKVAQIQNISEKKTELSTSCLKNRICRYLHSIPAVIAAATLVMAVVCALVWKQKELTITFAIGSAFAIYAMYKSCDTANLKTYGENNEQFSGSLKILNAENQELKTQVHELKGEMSVLKATNDSLIEANKTLEQIKNGLNFEKEEISKVKDNLQNQLDELSKVKEAIEQRTEAQIQDLGKLYESLKGIQNSATGNHKEFKTNLDVLINAIVKMQSSHMAFSNASSGLEKTMGEQADLLLKNGKMMVETFSEICKWKDENAVGQTITNLQKLEELLRQKEEEQQKYKEELIHLKGEILGCQKTIQELSRIKEGFSEQLDKLIECTKETKDNNVNVNAITEKLSSLAEVIKQGQEVRKSVQITKNVHTFA